MFETAPPTPHAFANGDGTFILEGLAPGARRLLAFSNDAGPVIVNINVPESGEAEFINITIERFGGFRVAVSRGGAPAPELHARLRRDDPAAPLSTDVWSNDFFFSMLGAVGGFASSSTPADSLGITHIARVPAGEWNIDIFEPAKPGSPEKLLHTARARAIGLRDVPVFVEIPQ